MTRKQQLGSLLILAACLAMGPLSCSTHSTKNSRAIFNKHADVEIAEDYSSVRSKDDEPELIFPNRGNNRDTASTEEYKPVFRSTGSFDWPVNRARLTRGFMPSRKRPHLGLDLAASRGTDIYSAQAGTVIYRGNGFHGFGKMVLIESGYGWATLYAHLDKYFVEEGQKVNQGDVIGAMGKTGRASGVHLHFEIRKDRGPVNPLQYLPGGQSIAVRD
ncbi:MAG: M23 family metallopeptidase [Bdellovibrionota bacterium]